MQVIGGGEGQGARFNLNLEATRRTGSTMTHQQLERLPSRSRGAADGP
jgi:hypothetical protein